MESALVFEAMIACPGVTASSSPNTACLICIFSGTASTTKSTSPKPSYSVVPVMRPRISFCCVSACSWVIFSFFTRPPSWPWVTCSAFSRPWSTNFWSTSLSTTSRPAAAITWAISPPIVPAPTTAALNTYMNPPKKLLRSPAGYSDASSLASLANRAHVLVSESLSARRMKSKSVIGASGPLCASVYSSARSKIVRPLSSSSKLAVCVPASLSSNISVCRRNGGSHAITFCLTRPRPRGFDSHTSRAPSAGHSESRVSMCAKSSMNVGQRRTSAHRANARSGGSSTAIDARVTRMLRSVASVDLVHDLVDRARDRLEERAHLAHQAVELRLAFVGQGVVAAAAPLRVLPAALDQPSRLELPEQRVHRVRVDAQHSLGHGGDALHELVSVRGAVVDEVQDQQRQHLALAELAGERVAAEPPRAAALLGHADRLGRLACRGGAGRVRHGVAGGLAAGLAAGLAGGLALPSHPNPS